MPSRRAAIGQAPHLPKLRGARSTFTRGPRALQRSQLGGQQHAAYPPIPGRIRAQYPAISEPEWAIYWAHLKRGLTPGIDFEYQGSGFQGGRQHAGGFVPDFVDFDVGIALNIEGEYVHYGRGQATILHDAQNRFLLGQYGLQLIFIDAEPATRAPLEMLDLARRGIDLSRKGPARHMV